jgi:cytochrome c oxidase subunit 2
MSRSLAISFWALAAIVVALFCSLRWGAPPSIASHAGMIDHQFKITLLIMGVGFCLFHLLLGLAIWPRRKRESKASGGSAKLEIVTAVLVTVVFLFLAVTGQRVWATLRLSEAPPDALEVEVVGQQFQWNFRYPGADGRFGRTLPQLYNDADNSFGARPGPLGIDPQDPAGKDDIVSSGVMVIPVNRPIKITLRAKDVTHDFYAPVLRLKQDAVPGMKINLHFMAVKEGRFEIACAELCGQLHHQMRAYLEVRSQPEYERWLRERTPAK